MIIPSFNHGHYLSMAIRSVLLQDHPAAEIIVIDDGSMDHTQQVASAFPTVRYVKQENRGLPASRNKGFELSRGQYILFLDADDILYPTAISANLKYLQQDPGLAFVSGCHNVVDESGVLVDSDSSTAPEDPFLELLKRNYIGMNAAVLYRRDTIAHFPFDESLNACEDYDQYLRITRKKRVHHHQHKIAAYKKHGENMSSDPVLMLSEVLKVLLRQYDQLENNAEKKAWREGIQNWKGRYLPMISAKLQASRKPLTREELAIWRDHWYQLLKIRLRKFLAQG